MGTWLEYKEGLGKTEWGCLVEPGECVHSDDDDERGGGSTLAQLQGLRQSWGAIWTHVLVHAPPFLPLAMGPSGPSWSLCPHSQPACQVSWEQQRGGKSFALCHPWVGGGLHRPLCVLCAGEGGVA